VPLDTKTDRCWVCGPQNPAGLKGAFEHGPVIAEADASMFLSEA